METHPFAHIQELLVDHDAEARGWFERLLIAEVDDRYQIDFYADPHHEAFGELLKVLCEPEIAARVHLLKFHAPDRGANGTRDWDFGRLVESEVMFPALVSLAIEQYEYPAHNHPIVTWGSRGYYDEGGVLARWLTKAPQLRFLAAPSAPNEDFFKIGRHPLEYLQLQVGYKTENFIQNLSRSDCFPDLRMLDYTDFDQRYMEDYQQSCTPLNDFRELFQSKAFASVKSFMWRESIFSAAELASLKALRPGLNFQIIHASMDWI